MASCGRFSIGLPGRRTLLQSASSQRFGPTTDSETTYQWAYDGGPTRGTASGTLQSDFSDLTLNPIKQKVLNYSDPYDNSPVSDSTSYYYSIPSGDNNQKCGNTSTWSKVKTPDGGVTCYEFLSSANFNFPANQVMVGIGSKTTYPSGDYVEEQWAQNRPFNGADSVTDIGLNNPPDQSVVRGHEDGLYWSHHHYLRSGAVGFQQIELQTIRRLRSGRRIEKERGARGQILARSHGFSAD